MELAPIIPAEKRRSARYEISGVELWVAIAAINALAVAPADISGVELAPAKLAIKFLRIKFEISGVALWIGIFTKRFRSRFPEISGVELDTIKLVNKVLRLWDRTSGVELATPIEASNALARLAVTAPPAVKMVTPSSAVRTVTPSSAVNLPPGVSLATTILAAKLMVPKRFLSPIYSQVPAF